MRSTARLSQGCAFVGNVVRSVGDGCDRERESSKRGREEKKNKWGRKRDICAEGREKKVR